MGTGRGLCPGHPSISGLSMDHHQTGPCAPYPGPCWLVQECTFNFSNFNFVPFSLIMVQDEDWAVKGLQPPHCHTATHSRHLSYCPASAGAVIQQSTLLHVLVLRHREPTHRHGCTVFQSSGAAPVAQQASSNSAYFHSVPLMWRFRRIIQCAFIMKI